MQDKKIELNDEELDKVSGGKIVIRKGMPTTGGLMINKTNINKNKFVCESCGKSFNSMHDLTLHKEKFHSKFF